MTRSRLTRRVRNVAVCAMGVTLAAGALASCTSESSGSDGSRKVTVLSSWVTDNVQGDTFNALTAKFEKETGIEVAVEESGPNDINGRFESTSLAGEEADVLITNLSGQSTGYLADGQVVDVTKYIDDWGLRDTITKAGIDFWTQADGIAGFPYQGFNWPVWYNTAAFKKAGIDKIPATVDELLADIPKLRAVGIQPMALGGAEWPVTNWITWMGQQYLSQDEAKQLFSKGGWCDSANAVKGLDLFAKLRDAGLFIDNVQGYTADQMTGAYAAGKVAMMPSGSWAYTYLKKPDEIKVRDATTLGGFPVVNGGQYTKPTAYQGHNVGLWLTPNGQENIDAVRKFIEFMYKPETAQTWVTKGQQIMDVNPSVLGDAKADEPLVTQGSNLEGKVDWMLLPDTYVPTKVNMQPDGTLFIGSKQPASQLCKKLDKLYKDAGIS